MHRSPFAVQVLGGAAGSLLAAIFPSDCRICRTPLATFSRLPVCSSCLESIVPVQCSRCYVCADALAEHEHGPVCVECSRKERYFRRAASFAAYGGTLRELVHLLKYQRVRPAAAVLGQTVAMSAASLVGEFESEEVLLVPVPLHRARFRERGFNQAELIASAARSGVAEAFGRKIRLETAALMRRRATEAQFGLTLEQRMTQVKGAFRVMFPDRIKGREVLLVDDVLTTGATVSECARVLLRAGAARVCVATAARAMKHANDSASELVRQSMEGGITVGAGPLSSGASRAASNIL